MKKMLVVLIAVITMFTICACSSGNGDTEVKETPQQKAENIVKERAKTSVRLNWKISGEPTCSCTTTSLGDNRYKVVGTIYFKSDTGYSFCADFVGESEYLVDEDRGQILEFEIGSPRRC